MASEGEGRRCVCWAHALSRHKGSGRLSTGQLEPQGNEAPPPGARYPGERERAEALQSLRNERASSGRRRVWGRYEGERVCVWWSNERSKRRRRNTEGGAFRGKVICKVRHERTLLSSVPCPIALLAPVVVVALLPFPRSHHRTQPHNHPQPPTTAPQPPQHKTEQNAPLATPPPPC